MHPQNSAIVRRFIRKKPQLPQIPLKEIALRIHKFLQTSAKMRKLVRKSPQKSATPSAKTANSSAIPRRNPQLHPQKSAKPKTSANSRKSPQLPQGTSTFHKSYYTSKGGPPGGGELEPRRRVPRGGGSPLWSRFGPRPLPPPVHFNFLAPQCQN